MKKAIFTLLLLCSFTYTLMAQRQEVPFHPDSIRISLLTCDSGKEIYSLFGHTAIRFQDFSRDIDCVFNYGVFSFNTPNFILRFALGDAEYILRSVPYAYFLSEYTFTKRKVWEQELNLTAEEKIKLGQKLLINAQPEHRSYCYNFFYDNCATRPRDRIEEIVNGELNYKGFISDEEAQKLSFRQLIHKYTHGHPWERFGIDLCLGREADNPITARETMFIPFYLQRAFQTAEIVGDSVSRPLVSGERIILDIKDKENKEDFWLKLFSPLRTFLLLFIIVVTLTIYGLKKRKALWGIDIALFSIAGIIGCVLTFLALFSQHPTVDSNYLLFVFHPFHLIFLPWMIKEYKKKEKSTYNIANCIVLTLFIVVFPIFPQRFDFAIVPLALCLLVRSMNQLILAYQKQE